MKYERYWLWLLILAGSLGILYSVGMVLDWPDWLHGSNWVWVRRIPQASIRLWWLAGALVGWVLVAGWVTQHQKWRKWQIGLLLISAVFLTPLMQLLIAAQHRSQPLSVAFLTTVSFMQEGVTLEDPAVFMQNHASQMPYYRSVHLQTQPPGWPVAFWAAREVWELFPEAAESVGRWFRRYDCFSTDLQGLTPAQLAAATLQMAILLVSGLGVLPLYGLGRMLFSEQAGRTAVLFYPLLPGYLVFQARYDVLYAVLGLVVLWLLYQYLFTMQLRYLGVLVVLLAGSTFFAFGVLAIAGMAAAHLLVYGVWRREIRPFFTFTLLFAGCLAATWAAFWLLWHASWLEMFQISRQIHEVVRINYPIWPLFNLYDFGVFLGLPLLVMALAGVVSRLWGTVSSNQWESISAWGWLLSLLVLNLSGEVRAETGRLWLFLAPPGLLVAVASISYVSSFEFRVSRFTFYVFLFAFALQALATGYFLGGRVPPTTVPEPQWDVPSGITAVSYQLGDAFRLQGYTVEEGTDQLQLTLYWQSSGWPTGDYSVFVHLQQAGQVTSQSDGLPMSGALPTWCWVPGEVVADEHVLAWDGKRPYSFSVGLYDWRDGQRLVVQPTQLNNAIFLSK